MQAQLEKISFPREDLQFVMLLGHGEFGEVFLAKGKSFREDGTEAEGEALVMVKALQTRDETALFNFKREIDLYYKLNHENVSKLVRLCRENDPHYMIMDYSDWGDLKQFLLATRQDCIRPLPAPKPPPLTVSQILQVISQVALGMEHLSNHRFIHKDLATRNCLISSGLRIKIGNPSLCKDTYSAEYFTVRNHTTSIRWLPAEAVLEDDFSTKSDVWSFAVSVWETIHQAAMPFSTKTNDQVVAALERKELRWTTADMENKVPAGLHKLLTQCWDASPKNRPNFSAIVIQLSEIIKDELNFSSGRK
ncbi:Inactive tyrosine-protein kinase 7 [Folsomia candida]|uniref:Inactive tyrosine-protein kinase 7 n=1 Tax=Folsomia candida TaxID=158441 RepID=A0A226ETY3_FOLCA|nr:Inactive tyrosine-protein kinase 7 [Folsomia candida]